MCAFSAIKDGSQRWHSHQCGPFVCSLIFGTANFVFTFNLSMHLSSQNRFSPVITNIHLNFAEFISSLCLHCRCWRFLLSFGFTLLIVLLLLFFGLYFHFFSASSSYLWHLLIWHANGSIFLTSFVISLPF